MRFAPVGGLEMLDPITDDGAWSQGVVIWDDIQLAL
jgi:hypothetical protein